MAVLIEEDEDGFTTIPASAAVFPKFGKGLLNYFDFDENYINLNSGPYL